jgi:hypothetical protein
MMIMTAIIFGLIPMPAIYMLRRQGGLAAMPNGKMWRTRFGALKVVAAQLALSYTFLGFSLAVCRGALAHLFSRALVFDATIADDIGQLPRRTHLMTQPMRQAARDALVLFALAGALAVWNVYLGPSNGPVGVAIVWRFHLVWFMPLAVVALSPWVFHPYVITGRDLPRRLRTARRPEETSHLAPHTPEWAAARRRGAA